MPVRSGTDGARRRPADPGRRRHHGAQQARRDRRAVVVAAVHRRAGVVRRRAAGWPAAAATPARGQVHRLRADPGHGHRAGCRAPGRSPYQVTDRDPAARPTRSGSGSHEALAGAGAVPGQAAGRRDAARDRGGVRRVRHAAVPAVGRDLDMHCSCPDWGVPCKHLAAVCYVLAEEFDDDPFGCWPGAGGAGRTARRAAPDPGGRDRPGREAAPGPAAGRPVTAAAAGRVPGRVLVARAEPGPAAGAGHRAGARRPRTCCCACSSRRRSPSGARTWPTCSPPPTSVWPATTADSSSPGSMASPRSPGPPAAEKPPAAQAGRCA